MKRWALLLVMACAGCDGCAEENNIRTCGFACQNGGGTMVKWSKTDGCVCGPAEKPQ